MDEARVWKTSLKKHFIYTNDIEKIKAALAEGYFFQVKESHTPGEVEKTRFDDIAKKSGLKVILLDEERQATICESSALEKGIYMTHNFFEKHKDEIIEVKRSSFEEGAYVKIEKEIFSEEIFDELVNNKVSTVRFDDVDLSDEQIEKLNDNFIDAYLFEGNDYKKISSNLAIFEYDKESLKKKDMLYVDPEVKLFSKRDIKNFKYLNDETTIRFDLGFLNENNIPDDYFVKVQNEMFLENIIQILERLEELNKNVKVEIPTSRAVDFPIDILSKYSNNIVVSYNNDKYSFDAFSKMNSKLDNLVSDIIDNGLSPFEKYIAVYDIVKNYKPYKECEEDPLQARSLKYILDNEYMVCVGYAHLLIELFAKVGIDATEYLNTVYFDIDEGQKLEEGHHARVMVNLKDDKYGIDGYYISDPTWDNTTDFYNFAIMTQNSMQTYKNMMNLTNKDLAFDVESFDDFCLKANTYLKREVSEKSKRTRIKLTTREIINDSFEKYIKLINKVMGDIDKHSYQKLTPLYEKAVSSGAEEDYSKVLTEAGQIISKKANNKISNDTLFNGIVASKEKRGVVAKGELEKYREAFLKNKQECDMKLFPYELDDTIKEGIKVKV